MKVLIVTELMNKMKYFKNLFFEKRRILSELPMGNIKIAVSFLFEKLFLFKGGFDFENFKYNA